MTYLDDLCEQYFSPEFDQNTRIKLNRGITNKRCRLVGFFSSLACASQQKGSSYIMHAKLPIPSSLPFCPHNSVASILHLPRCHKIHDSNDVGTSTSGNQGGH
jgi:hypothetical protein